MDTYVTAYSFFIIRKLNSKFSPVSVIAYFFYHQELKLQVQPIIVQCSILLCYLRSAKFLLLLHFLKTILSFLGKCFSPKFNPVSVTQVEKHFHKLGLILPYSLISVQGSTLLCYCMHTYVTAYSFLSSGT